MCPPPGNLPPQRHKGGHPPPFGFPPASPADCPGTPINFTCAAGMNPALRQGFRLWQKHLYAGLPARTLTKHVPLSQGGSRSIVDRPAVDQMTKPDSAQKCSKFDKDQLGKGIQNLGFGGFSVHFWASKSAPRGAGVGNPRKLQGRGGRRPHIVTTRNIAPSPAEPAKPAFDQRYFYEMEIGRAHV